MKNEVWNPQNRGSLKPKPGDANCGLPAGTQLRYPGQRVRVRTLTLIPRISAEITKTSVVSYVMNKFIVHQSLAQNVGKACYESG